MCWGKENDIHRESGTQRQGGLGTLYFYDKKWPHDSRKKNGKGKDTSIKEALVLVGILRGKRQQDQQRISEEQ